MVATDNVKIQYPHSDIGSNIDKGKVYLAKTVRTTAKRAQKQNTIHPCIRKAV